ncbi:hypothetical protein E1I18_02315 [Mycoplasmopsis mucosicanis]|uniref:Uncharacterized protein n=1 Tax=Mycoplasmopsis mucosicanis TaxID=458208 RepID=A0A507SMN8_9BACT|nr:hypothetical protein [Mycoplasmopsis mucosicanis]TQC51495.1 hypothetical protein E1I18_02315 [Mycoplasmopsis mucosicanis]
MITKHSSKYIISADKTKVKKCFTLEDALTGKKSKYCSLFDITQLFSEKKEDPDTRIWFQEDNKFIGSLSYAQLKSDVNDLISIGVHDNQSVEFLINNNMLDQDHKLAFVDTRRTKIITLLTIATTLLVAVILICVLIFVKVIPTK